MKDQFKEINNSFDRWYSSSEYSLACSRFDEEITQLISTAERMRGREEELKQRKNTQTVRTAICSGSNIPRGYYCPSPIYDLVVGNVKRGKLVKRMTVKTKNYFQYGFDQNGRLIWVEQYCNGELAYTEHIRPAGQSIIGVCLDRSNRIQTIIKECYQNEKLASYTIASVSEYVGICKCNLLRREDYVYDMIGLVESTVHTYYPGKIYTKTIYHFEREDGYLSKYSVSDDLEDVQSNRTAVFYNVREQRKA